MLKSNRKIVYQTSKNYIYIIFKSYNLSKKFENIFNKSLGNTFFFKNNYKSFLILKYTLIKSEYFNKILIDFFNKENLNLQFICISTFNNFLSKEFFVNSIVKKMKIENFFLFIFINFLKSSIYLIKLILLINILNFKLINIFCAKCLL